jgi:O-succinylhomoserine sulfhydrylase
LKGLETLVVRMRAQSATAQQLAEWLEQQPQVARVHFPGLASHPQAELAARQQSQPGAVLGLELRGKDADEQRLNAWRLIDATRLMSITANLGDTRTTITHPATTTHGRLTPGGTRQCRDHRGPGAHRGRSRVVRRLAARSAARPARLVHSDESLR